MNISKDQALENAIVSCVRNPRHCLYFKTGTREIARTYVNSNKFYYLPTERKYERSIHVHELAHTFTCQGLPHEEIYLIGSMLDEVGASEQYGFPEYFDAFFAYHTEIALFLEAIAYLTQIAATGTPSELREGMISDLQTHNPILLHLAHQLFWVSNRFLEFKAKRATHTDYYNVSLELFRLILATSRLGKERIFDRFRLVRDTAEDGIREWKRLSDVTRVLITRLRDQEYVVLDLRRPMLVVSQAMFWEAVVNLARKHGSEVLKPFVFGFLKELDYTWGPISFCCKSLHSLSRSRVGLCYLHQQLQGPAFMQSPKELLIELNEIASKKRYQYLYRKHRELLTRYRAALGQIKDMKVKLHGLCPGPEVCQHRSFCQIEKQVFSDVNKYWIQQEASSNI